MRITTWLTIPLFGVLMAVPAFVPAQVNIKVEFGARLGPEVGVVAYAPERHGDWRVEYRKWTPVVLYDVNGHYYRNEVRGSRPILVYTYRNEYFLPPQDKAWVGLDKRYNYAQRPVEVDYGRVRPYEAPIVVDARLGEELGVTAFSVERAGDWRANYKRWTPVVAYEVKGRYYPHQIPGAHVRWRCIDSGTSIFCLRATKGGWARTSGSTTPIALGTRTTHESTFGKGGGARSTAPHTAARRCGARGEPAAAPLTGAAFVNWAGDAAPVEGRYPTRRSGASFAISRASLDRRACHRSQSDCRPSQKSALIPST